MSDVDEAMESGDVYPIIAFAVTSIILIIILFLVFQRQDPSRAGQFVPGDNCNLLTCPSTIITIPGEAVTGPPGRTGERGPEGPQGPQGATGPIGPSGVAMCLANPACGVGPTGPTG